MANQNAKIDDNFKKTLLAITDDVNQEVRRLLVDPITGRLKCTAVVTSGAIGSLNGLTAPTQTFAIGTTGTDFNIVSATSTHTFNLPTASATNRGLLSTADWTTFNGKLTSPMTNAGDMIYGGALGVATRLPIGGANTVLHGGVSVPAYSAVVEADISLSANTTNNATAVRHGFLPQLSALTTQFLRGDGAWAVPAGTTLPNAYYSETFSYTADTPHNLVHNFGTYPVAQAFNSGGYQIIPYSVRQVDVNTTAITFQESADFTIILTIGSPALTAYTSTSGNYNVLAGDYLVEETGATKIVTLPTPVGRSGKIFIIKNSSVGVCDIQTAAGTIDGVADVTLVAGDSLTVVSNNTIWLVI